MRYLQRLQNDIKHTNSLAYLFKDNSYGLEYLDNYEMIVKYRDKVRFERRDGVGSLLLHLSIEYTNIRFIKRILEKNRFLFEDLLCRCAEVGNFKLLEFFSRYIKTDCPGIIYHTANGHPRCMKYLYKLRYYKEEEKSYHSEYCSFTDNTYYICTYIGYIWWSHSVMEIALRGHPKCLNILYKWGVYPTNKEISMVARHPKCLKLVLKHLSPQDEEKILILYRDCKKYPKCWRILLEWDNHNC